MAKMFFLSFFQVLRCRGMLPACGQNQVEHTELRRENITMVTPFCGIAQISQASCLFSKLFCQDKLWKKTYVFCVELDN